MISRQRMGTYRTSNVLKPPQDVQDIWPDRSILPPTLPQEIPHNCRHPNPLRVIRLGRPSTLDRCVHDLRFLHWKERVFTHQHLVDCHTQDIDVHLFRRDPFFRVEFGRERRSSGATKDVVSCEMAVTRVKPKSARTFWGRVESVMRMFNWGHDNHMI